jgi:MFS family permease
MISVLYVFQTGPPYNRNALHGDRSALSILTTTFTEGKERHAALGVWAGVGGLASAAGVLLGGVLTQGPGWRWVMFVNPVAAVLVLGGIFGLLSGERRRARLQSFDIRGAILATGGMLLLVYTVVSAPTVGWGTARTIAELAGALALLAAFVVNEQRTRTPSRRCRSSASTGSRSPMPPS